MSEQLPPDDSHSQPPTLDYRRADGRKPFSILRVIGIVLLVLFGIGLLIFGICTVALIYHA